MLRLVIGNKNYSSWSLRAFLYLRASGLEFDEIRLRLDQPEFAQQIKKYNPAGLVPVLIDGDIRIADSMAIIHYVRDAYPASLAWPGVPKAKALALSICEEMHSGFPAIRSELPQNLRGRCRLEADALSDAAHLEIERIVEIWRSCFSMQESEEPWLFGQFSIVG